MKGRTFSRCFFDVAEDHPEATFTEIPGDMVTASASGLDPHITLQNAEFQLDRVASKWAANLKRDPATVRKEIEQILQQNASRRLAVWRGKARQRARSQPGASQSVRSAAKLMESLNMLKACSYAGLVSWRFCEIQAGIIRRPNKKKLRPCGEASARGILLLDTLAWIRFGTLIAFFKFRFSPGQSASLTNSNVKVSVHSVTYSYV